MKTITIVEASTMAAADKRARCLDRISNMVVNVDR
jgi:hypothetical protein